jgi:uncharacterized protein (TIGR03067 family)
MKRMALLLAYVLIVRPVGDSQAAPAPPSRPAELLTGTWTITSGIMNGEETAVMNGTTFTFKNGKLTMSIGVEEHQASYKLDASKKPAEIDIVPVEGSERGKTIKGIFSVTGEELKLCIPNAEDGARPKEFVSKAGTRVGLVTLKRKKP